MFTIFSDEGSIRCRMLIKRSILVLDSVVCDLDKNIKNKTFIRTSKRDLKWDKEYY